MLIQLFKSIELYGIVLFNFKMKFHRHKILDYTQNELRRLLNFNEMIRVFKLEINKKKVLMALVKYDLGIEIMFRIQKKVII